VTQNSNGPAIAAPLLRWYDRQARSLPWRVPPGSGVAADPYKVWLSEIMLQQTTVVAVRPYFEAFLERWPRVQDLAAAELDDVLTAWAGLGYYARARNLHKCARYVAEILGGRFPRTEEELKMLPGIGPYTASAIAAIAFNRKATVVDGNVERVVSRLFKVTTPLPASKPELRRLAETITPEERPGDFAQAMMDLGATICLPKSPKCLLCPLNSDCSAHFSGVAADLPRKTPKPAKPTRRAVAFFVTRSDGSILLRRRAEKGLLGGMMEVPSTDWREAPWSEDETLGHAPLVTEWRQLDGMVRHTFTHFHFEVTVWAGRADAGLDIEDGRWVVLDKLGGQALPSVMQKVVRHGLEAGGRRFNSMGRRSDHQA